LATKPQIMALTPCHPYSENSVEDIPEPELVAGQAERVGRFWMAGSVPPKGPAPVRNDLVGQYRDLVFSRPRNRRSCRRPHARPALDPGSVFGGGRGSDDHHRECVRQITVLFGPSKFYYRKDTATSWKSDPWWIRGCGMTNGGLGPERPSRPVDGRIVLLVDILVVAVLLALLAFAPLAHLAAAAQPQPPDKEPRLPALTGNHPNRRVRDLPSGLPDGVSADSPADLQAIAGRALGQGGGRTLLTLLAPSAEPLRETAVGGKLGFAPYPYRYPAMTRLLDQAHGQARTPEASELGAALLVLASRPGEYGNAFPNAAAAAFAVLDRARADGDCDAQLNLLLLVAADDQPRDAPVRDEARRAEAVCPDDPTPGWLLGQYQSQRANLDPTAGLFGDPVPANAQLQALATFARLEVRFPGSAAPITGAADVHLRTGIRLAERQPFTARHALRMAAAGYRKAHSMGADDAAVGLARALVGLGEPARAAALLRDWIAAHAPSGPLLELLTIAEEAAHEFGRAEWTALELAGRGPGAYPAGPPFFPIPNYEEVSERTGRDPLGPQSLGTDTHAPLAVSLQPSPGGAGGSVNDVSFIPVFRSDYPIVGIEPSCPGRAWRRDAVLAGRARAALVNFPADPESAFKDVRPTRQGPRSCTLRGRGPP
jgi:hypothetical protein